MILYNQYQMTAGIESNATYPPRKPPIGFRVPRMYDDAGGAEETAGGDTCLGVVTVVFVRDTSREG